MRRRIAFGLLTVAGSLLAQPPALDLAKFQQVLTEYVRDDGRVDYAGLRANSGRLDYFVAQIAAVSPDSAAHAFPTRNDRLAYWINAYNALVLHAFSREYPEKRNRLNGLLGRALFFYRTKHRVGGANRSLADIEDNTIRKFGDPRIHFAIVCASASCPWLSRTAYTGINIEAQLEAEARKYFGQERNFRLDEATKTVYLPQIFEWFRGDFGATPSAVLEFVSRYRMTEGGKLKSGVYRIRYTPYDWSPNDVAPRSWPAATRSVR
jgi:hypothetical protein